MKPMYELEYVDYIVVAGTAVKGRRTGNYKGDVLDIFYLLLDNKYNMSMRIVDKSHPGKPHVTRIWVRYDKQDKPDPNKFLIDALGQPEI